MKKKASIPQPDLIQDLVLDLHNKRVTVYDTRAILDQLDQFHEWAFIIPRGLLGAITQPYEMAEMDYDSMLSEPNSAQAVVIYQQHDAVMVKKDWTLKQ
jgi:hypothetical protein